MKHILIITTLTCFAAQAMDTKEQLKTQLHAITFNGQYNVFAQQREIFAQMLNENDILKAKQRCEARLLALENLTTMYRDTRIKELFFTMQAEMKESNTRLFAYIDEAEKKYKPDTPEQEHIFGTAAEILRSIELHATSYTGDYLVDLQAKIMTQAPQPLIFLKVETENTIRLKSELQRTLRNKVGYQLHQIVFDGNYEAFQQNKEQFKRMLDASDLVKAQENCNFRLFAIESIKKMRTNPRLNLLVMSMEQDQELPMLDWSVAVNKYRKDSSFDEAKAALDIYYATWPHSAIYNGCFADIQEKIDRESNPHQYLEKEKQNILQLRDALQKIIPDMPKELADYAQRCKTLRFTKDYFTLAE